jgi:LysM repeat protein
MLYNVPELPPAQARQITQLLDQVAGTVIYSRHYPLEPPYKVQSGDRLDQIAQRYNVPWELLARINGLRNPERLTPGQELKVVRGPFNAVINLDRYEMTLMLQDRYAGRFPIGIGRDKAKLEGTYTVRDKIVAPIYQGPDGATAGAGEANNPLGRFLLDLGNQVGIHGTSDRGNVGRAEGRGSICLSDRDIDDVFGILSIGSRVVIQR